VTPSDPTQPTGSGGSGMLPEYKVFYELNNDTVGWICIPGTKVNYPVMQPPDNRDYYLKHTFYKQWSDWGAIYAREDCDISTPSDNITLYGHHMMDGSMFAQLDYFMKKDFWQTHQTFSFDTLYEHHTYQIFAVFKTSAISGKGFPYHRFVNAADEAEFNEFVSTIKKLAFYDTGVSAEYGEKLLCLSTCEYTLEDGRLVVVAKRIS
jgi:sortase B